MRGLAAPPGRPTGAVLVVPAGGILARVGLLRRLREEADREDRRPRPGAGERASRRPRREPDRGGGRVHQGGRRAPSRRPRPRPPRGPFVPRGAAAIRLPGGGGAGAREPELARGPGAAPRGDSPGGAARIGGIGAPPCPRERRARVRCRRDQRPAVRPGAIAADDAAAREREAADLQALRRVPAASQSRRAELGGTRRSRRESASAHAAPPRASSGPERGRRSRSAGSRRAEGAARALPRSSSFPSWSRPVPTGCDRSTTPSTRSAVSSRPPRPLPARRS